MSNHVGWASEANFPTNTLELTSNFNMGNLIPEIGNVDMKVKGRKATETAINTITGSSIYATLSLGWVQPQGEDGLPADLSSPYMGEWIYNVRDVNTQKIVATGSFAAVDDDGKLTNQFHTSDWVLDQNGYSKFQVSISTPVTPNQIMDLDNSGMSVTEGVGTIHALPGYLTLVPIIVLMVVAIVSHQNLVAMYCGIFVASTFVRGYNPLLGFIDSWSVFMVEAVNDADRIRIILFTFFLSGMIGLITASGGAQGMAKVITKYATNRNRALWMTFALGCIIFFDDYASALIVGSNMRPITDMLFISREKLAFLVHATSSPPASVAPISSWIGFEIGAIRDQLQAIPKYKDEDPFLVFMETIPSRFFPWFMLIFIVIIIAMKRDFGPMLKAERRAIFEKKVLKTSSAGSGGAAGGDGDELLDEMGRQKPARWYNAVLPVVLCLAVTVAGLLLTGYYNCLDSGIAHPTIADIAGAGQSSDALIWGSMLGSILAIAMTRLQGIMSFGDTMAAWVDGIKGVVDALLTLLMAWTISVVFKELGLPQFVTQALSGALDPRILPACVFLTSCFISFSLGSSWGTMSIMFPLAIPLVYGLAPDSRPLLIDTISSILTGSIFGDQCSPLADTSILSSLSSGIPVKDHISSQLPYALLVAFTSLLVGYVPAGYALLPSWGSLLLGTIMMAVIFYFLSVPTESLVPGKFSSIKLFKSCSRDDSSVSAVPYDAAYKSDGTSNFTQYKLDMAENK